MEKIIIAAVSENGVIGKGDEIPWHYPEDFKYFRRKTMGSPVIMGSKTYRSLPDEYRPLEGRENIVLTRSGVDLDEEFYEASSLEEAFEEARETGDDRMFIAGGASVYEQSLEEADRMLLTRIHEEYDGDKFFPEWNESEWKEVRRDDREEFSFLEYVSQ